MIYNLHTGYTSTVSVSSFSESNNLFEEIIMSWFTKTSFIKHVILCCLHNASSINSKSSLRIRGQTLFIVFMLLIFSGCESIDKTIKADPAPSAGFLPAPELLSEMRERYPFHGAWMNMNVEDFHAYDSIYIAPMDTSHLAENDWWDEANLNFSTLDEDATNFAHESEAIFRESFVEGMKLSVADAPGTVRNGSGLSFCFF